MRSLAQEVQKQMQQCVNKGTDEGTTGKKNVVVGIKNIAPRKFRGFI